MRPGIHLVHKPVGVTSFSLVQTELQKARAEPGRRVPLCHGGTLDPFAEGLLLLLAGQATRVMDELHVLPKVYRADVAWGAETDNGDPTGTVVARADAGGLTPSRLDEALGAFLGWRDQVPPATSAKKLGGEPAYRKVHRGETVVLPPSRVYLHEAHWVEHALPHRSTLELTCRGGYYVRALVRDLGRSLGCPAHLATLHRTQIGPWRDPGPGAQAELHGEQLLPWWPRRTLGDAELGALRRGGTVPRGTLAPATWNPPAGFAPLPEKVQAFHLGRLVGLLVPEGTGWRLERELLGGL